tara:strand:- start:179 stop:1621 length:1443 start_codon:yes stop_codon:yes gene_type:complete
MLKIFFLKIFSLVFIFSCSSSPTKSSKSEDDIINNAPINLNLSLNVSLGHSLEINLPSSDIDGDKLTYSINNPSVGSIQTINDTTFRYLSDVSGNISIIYNSNDGTNIGNEAKINISIINNLRNLGYDFHHADTEKFGNGDGLAVIGHKLYSFSQDVSSDGGQYSTNFTVIDEDLNCIPFVLNKTFNGQIVGNCPSMPTRSYDNQFSYNKSQYSAATSVGTYDGNFIFVNEWQEGQQPDHTIYAKVRKMDASLNNILWEKDIELPKFFFSNGFPNSNFQGHHVTSLSDGTIANGYSVPGIYPNRTCLLILNDSGEVVYNSILRNSVVIDQWFTSIMSYNDESFIVLASDDNSRINIMNVSKQGNILNFKRLPENVTGIAVPRSIKKTSDGGFIIVGMTNALGHATIPGNDWRMYDGLIIKLNANFQPEWRKTFGFSQSSDRFFEVLEVDDGYLCFGDSWEGGEEITGYIVKFDKNGNELY